MFLSRNIEIDIEIGIRTDVYMHMERESSIRRRLWLRMEVMVVGRDKVYIDILKLFIYRGITQRHIFFTSHIIPESVCSIPFLRVSQFYIQLALPISPEIMERFLCSRCLNDRIGVPDMMRLFAGGVTTPLVVKIWTKQPWVKIEYSRNFDHNFALFRGKIWL